MTKAERIAQRQTADAATLRTSEDDILNAVARLDPDDDSFRANYLREVATSIRDHRACAAQYAGSDR